VTHSSSSPPDQRQLRLLGDRPWLRALLICSCCMILGATAFLVWLGVELDENGGHLPASIVLLVLLDALIGVVAAVAVGPVRGSRLGNIVITIAAVASTWALPAWIVSVVRLGSRRSFVLDSAVVLVTAVGGLGYTLIREPSATSLGDVLVITLISVALTVVVLLWGRVRGTRSALVDALREQAKSAEEAQRATALMREAGIAQARAEERSAIARDMHDGISHQLAIVAMHAGALSYRTDLTTDQQRSTASTVRGAAADANVMLREALTALRETDDVRPTSPLPDTSSLERMVENARTAGHDISFEWKNITEAELAQSPRRAMTLARITEELLMNLRKHAPQAPASIRIENTTDAVILQVSNPIVPVLHGPTHAALGTGLGLIGVTERAALLGGAARYGATDLGTFDVEVRLP